MSDCFVLLFSYLGASIGSGLAILVVGLLLVAMWLGGPWHMRDDEREVHRREHAIARAYRTLGVFTMGVFAAAVGIPEPNPIASLLAPVVRAFLVQLPLLLLFAMVFLYVSLPPTILLWTGRIGRNSACASPKTNTHLAILIKQ